MRPLMERMECPVCRRTPVIAKPLNHGAGPATEITSRGGPGSTPSRGDLSLAPVGPADAAIVALIVEVSGVLPHHREISRLALARRDHRPDGVRATRRTLAADTAD